MHSGVSCADGSAWRHMPANVWLASVPPPGLRITQSATAPPPRLTEAALIAAMEAHGIGTDATVAEHIQKQLERRCDVKLSRYCCTRD
jgi:DNA topoisomerase IA